MILFSLIVILRKKYTNLYKDFELNLQIMSLNMCTFRKKKYLCSVSAIFTVKRKSRKKDTNTPFLSYFFKRALLQLAPKSVSKLLIKIK